MKRRSLLAAAGALGVGAVGVSADEDDPDCEETVEIATGRSGDEVTSTERVPAAWWEQVERVRGVQDELDEGLDDEPWFEGTGRSAGEREICGQHALVVTVYASDVETARSQLDEERNGVGVSIEEPPEMAHADGDVADAGDGGDRTGGADDDSDPTPGPGVLGALAGIGAAGVLLGWRTDPDR